ncbi:lipoprotein-releasing system transmembrane subunit LolE, partial [Cronobacter sakazakii]
TDIDDSGLVESGANLRAIEVKGVDPAKEQHLSALAKDVQNSAGQSFQKDEQEIIIGKGVAEAMKVREDDWLYTRIPNSGADHK